MEVIATLRTSGVRCPYSEFWLTQTFCWRRVDTKPCFTPCAIIGASINKRAFERSFLSCLEREYIRTEYMKDTQVATAQLFWFVSSPVKLAIKGQITFEEYMMVKVSCKVRQRISGHDLSKTPSKQNIYDIWSVCASRIL